MNVIYMDSKDSNHLILTDYLTDKIDFRRKDKYIALSNLSIYYTWKNIKKSYKNNKSKMSAPTWNEKFELPDGSYFISDNEDYSQCILKIHWEKIVNPSIKIYINKIESRVTLKIKTGYNLDILTPETMKLLGGTKSKIIRLKIMEMFLI